MNNWSIKTIQNLIMDREEWEKKNLYATDSGKCPTGLYYQLLGEEPTTPDDPKGLRRMEVGNIIEYNQVKKLKALGVLIDSQTRIYDEEYKVSGKPDGIVISPTECTDEAKIMIERKKQIFKELTDSEKKITEALNKYLSKELNRDSFIDIQTEEINKRQSLYDEDLELNNELLKPNPNNSLILIEIKSIVEAGFKWREQDGTPMDEHKNQIMFYLWKLRKKYPWILGRIIYVDTSYQNILEFNVDYNEDVIDNLKKFWEYINHCVENKTPPELIPDIIQNERTNKWQLNYKADWCRYHIHCTKDANWKTKALDKIIKLNSDITPKRRSYVKKQDGK